MIDCGNCGHPKRCPEAGRCIMGMMPPADVGPTRKPKERNVNTSTGNVRMKGQEKGKVNGRDGRRTAWVYRQRRDH